MFRKNSKEKKPDRAGIRKFRKNSKEKKPEVVTKPDRARIRKFRKNSKEKNTGWGKNPKV